MHHYMSEVARTIAPKGPVRQMWETAIPELSFANPFLLELLMSLSALHLFRSIPRDTAVRELAERHEAEGLKGLTKAMGNLETSNASAIYVSTTLSCYIHLGKGPTRGDCLVFGSEGSAPWFTMFRGIRSVAEMMPDGDFGAIMSAMKTRSRDQGEDTVQSPASSEIRGTQEWPFQIAMLRQQCDLERDGTNAIARAFTTLEDVFSKTFGTSDSAPLDADETGHLAFMWLYILPDEFVELAQNHDPVPLVVLSHFSILMKRLETQWWIRGWADNIVHSIKDMLSTEYHCLLEWPLQCLAP